MFSAKLERWDTEGEDPFRGVCRGVVVVLETALVFRTAAF